MQQVSELHLKFALKQHSHCAQRCVAVRSAALRSTARRCAAPRSAARHCAALPAIYLCKSYANVVNNQHGGHGSVSHRFLHE